MTGVEDEEGDRRVVDAGAEGVGVEL